jgi:hypothetical protein
VSPYDEAQARIRELLRPYAGHVDRETARRRLMESGPTPPLCTSCGAPRHSLCSDPPLGMDGWATAGETYLTEECAEQELRAYVRGCLVALGETIP